MGKQHRAFAPSVDACKQTSDCGKQKKGSLNPHTPFPPNSSKKNYPTANPKQLNGSLKTDKTISGCLLLAD
nr:hypothetical protein [uncultured Kingella sp.]